MTSSELFLLQKTRGNESDFFSNRRLSDRRKSNERRGELTQIVFT